MSGRVILVGAGPGDPDLITVAGLKALRAADVVVTDRLVPTELLEEIAEGAEVIHVGKIPRGEFTPQETINQILVDQALAGRTVVRFKGGDPFVFGRGFEEWQACERAGIPVSYVPGISSSIAGAGLAGVPVTHRGLVQGYAVVSGHVAPDDPRGSIDWDHLATSGLTIVIMMGVQNLPRITERLVAAGLATTTPAVVIENAGLPTMRVLSSPVGELAAAAEQAGVQPPAVTVIGEVAALAQPCS
ncbi:uroporphyrinogen-III C-methyltransferase [Arachnia propionica]|uniref:uroporphyrinogen-III C-methyltransferase n=1 Tax=Arachnia propionica TaxID=1750 RepID=A0A3P1T207_9ACTN|nr:uroporphyrinogen-III C-methyltransferase [Arachnia propionica]MDO5082303.1 uroporphyrinogen-III C-methyltransferase [Arachnia propionica]RRD03481.1 uroporphyrinogen-III C-methyltransferase [Arachnia propionica]